MSNIIDLNQELELFSLCDFAVGQKWRLLYRASDDGFAADDFHRKCDNTPNTLTIIQSTMGHVFGGYTDAMWNQNDGYKTVKNAFLFSLVNKENEPLKIKINKENEKYAMYCYPYYGPVFGGGFDLLISDNSNKNTESYSNLCHSFKHPVYQYGSTEAKNFLAGSYNFQVNEIEVYQKL